MNLDFIVYPLGSLLKIIYSFVGNYGLSIVIFTIIVRTALLPLTIKQSESSRKMNELNPKMKEIQEKYKGDKDTLNKKLMELYQEHNYNPASGCLPLLIQMPIIFSLFYVIQQPVKYVFGNQAAFEAVHKSFLWITNLGVVEQNATLFVIAGIGGLPILAILSGLSTWYQMKMITPNGSKVDPTMKTMNMMMPFMIAYFTYKVPAGLAIYWVIGNVFTIVQQYVTLKLKPAIKEGVTK